MFYARLTVTNVICDVVLFSNVIPKHLLLEYGVVYFSTYSLGCFLSLVHVCMKMTLYSLKTGQKEILTENIHK